MRDEADTPGHGTQLGSGSLPSRRRPSRGVLYLSGQPTIVFLTVCTGDRQRWLADAEVHRQLLSVWRASTAWLTGRYVVMPDHLHLFAAPGTADVDLTAWVSYWKSLFSRLHRNRSHRWQAGCWDTRLRGTESYEAKSTYVRENPVRAGLVAEADDWPYQGEMWELRW